MNPVYLLLPVGDRRIEENKKLINDRMVNCVWLVASEIWISGWLGLASSGLIDSPHTPSGENIFQSFCHHIKHTVQT